MYIFIAAHTAIAYKNINSKMHSDNMFLSLTLIYVTW